MPPEPVSGFCILPRVGDDVEHRRRGPRRRRRRACARAAGTTRRRGSAARRGPGPRRATARGGCRAARRPAAARRRARAPGAARRGSRRRRCTGRPLSMTDRRAGNLAAVSFDRPKILRLLWQRWLRSHKPTRPRPDGALDERRDLDRASRVAGTARPASPTPTGGSSSSSPTGPASPAGRDVTAEEWASAQWQRAHCVKNVKQLRALLGDLVDERVLRRPRARPARARHDVDARAAADDEHDGAARGRRRGPGSLTDAFYADPVRRYMLPVFSDRRTDWPSHPLRHPRLAARARHVGRRGAHPPLPHQGARRAAADLPAVLRPLHPHGPRRQLHRRSSTS